MHYFSLKDEKQSAADMMRDACEQLRHEPWVANCLFMTGSFGQGNDG
jgi:hypothetical protein